MNNRIVAGMTRRTALAALGAGAAAGLLMPHAATARPEEVAYLIRQHTRGAEIRPGRVEIVMPDRSETGTSVPLTLLADSPQTAEDHVRSIRVFADANTRPDILTAYLTPLSGTAEVSTRIRLDGAQTVTAIAEMADGTYWRADKDVVVAFGACADLGAAGGTPEYNPVSRVSVPETAHRGEIVTVRTLISHPMETGFRLDQFNTWIPLRIIERLACAFNGTEVFRTKLEPAVSTNPFVEFRARVEGSGTFDFTWLDTTGAVYTNQAAIHVETA